MTDCIIVGRGLAASALMHRFFEQGITFHVIGKRSLSVSSLVAGGVWNPIVFKRMTESWMAGELVSVLRKFYSACEQRLDTTLLYERDLVKPFVEEQEANLWLKRSKNELHDFLTESVIHEKPEDLTGCNLQGPFGIVKNAGNVDLHAFLTGTERYFKQRIADEVFDHSRLKITDASVVYGSLKARCIIFCEGFLVKNNPFFSWIPLKPAKGEVLVLESKELALNNTIYNRDGFILKLSNDNYLAGATYAWDDLTQEPTENGRKQLIKKLEKLISGNYKIVEHKAGIRPASVDRRPIIGRHPQYANLFVFNGLGTKGVMLAPYFSEKFVHFYLQKENLDPQVDVKRFYNWYEQQKK
jgi:glycine/D-amino acid oxidase-like deaminating enzyme